MRKGGLRFKLSYFDSKVDNYVIRNLGSNGTTLGIFFLNIDKARFSGFDLSSEYERRGFSARLSATYYTGVEFCNSTGCAENRYAGNYSKNHMPPKFQLALDRSQTVMDDRLTLGSRITRTGSRVNSPAQMPAGNSLIAYIARKPHTVVDPYAHYKTNDDLRVSFDIHNLAGTDYVQPLSLAATPGPSRTARVSLYYRF